MTIPASTRAEAGLGLPRPRRATSHRWWRVATLKPPVAMARASRWPWCVGAECRVMGGFAPDRETAKRGFPASPRILKARRKHARRLTRHWRRGIKLVMIILKILRKSEWQALRAEGQSDGAPVDV